jgi:deoxyribodipyrimidine photolyase
MLSKKFWISIGLFSPRQVLANSGESRDSNSLNKFIKMLLWMRYFILTIVFTSHLERYHNKKSRITPTLPV